MRKQKQQILPIQKPSFDELPLELQKQILQLAQQKLRGEVTEQSVVNPVGYVLPGTPIYLVVNNTNTNTNDNDNKPKVESVAASISESAESSTNSEPDVKSYLTLGLLSLLAICTIFTVGLGRK